MEELEQLFTAPYLDIYLVVYTMIKFFFGTAESFPKIGRQKSFA